MIPPNIEKPTAPDTDAPADNTPGIGDQTCAMDDNHVVKVTDAYACCQGQLKALQMNIQRVLDYFQAISESNTFGEMQEIHNAFVDADAVIGGAPAVAQSFMGPTLLNQSARVAQVVRTVGPKPGLIPWFLPGYEAGKDETHVGIAVVAPDKWWEQTTQPVLELMTQTLNAIQTTVRTRVNKKDCCACVRKKALGQTNKMKKRSEPYRARRQREEQPGLQPPKL